MDSLDTKQLRDNKTSSLTLPPTLEDCREDIELAYQMLLKCFERKGKVLICGNGGSASDAGHVVGELMKGFTKKRPLQDDIKQKLRTTHAALGGLMADKLQQPLSAIDLTVHNALIMAICNDIDPDLIFAQQVLGYAQKDDVLIGISTSGNSKNVINGMVAAKSLGISTIGFTGADGGLLKDFCDVTIKVPRSTTASIQELHLPIYHILCEEIEKQFFEI